MTLEKSLPLSIVLGPVVFISIAGFGFLNQPSGGLERGKSLYDRYCSTCHGLDGRGEGPASVYLFPKPRDFTRGIFKFQSTPVGSLPTDQDLLRTITRGMPGSAMPAWDRLGDEERSEILAYLKTFSERFQTEQPTDILTFPLEPPRTRDMIEGGKAVYALAGCWRCHGKTGAGDGPSANDLKDDFEQPIRPYNFTRTGAFKGGGTPKDIYRTFSTGIGGTPMPGYGEDALMIAREDVADLTSLEGQYTEEEIQQIRDYVEKWPTENQLSEMTPTQRKALADERRWSLVYYVLSLADPSKTQISYTTADRPVQSFRVSSLAPFVAPFAPEWDLIQGVELPLISLWPRDTPTDRVVVKSVTDGKSIVLRVEWEDPTKDDEALYNAKFGDAAAVQFPLDPTTEPFFAMGDTNLVTNIWHWKSWWEKDLQTYVGVKTAFPQTTVDFYPFDVSGGSAVENFISADSAKRLSMAWNAGWGSGNLLSAQTRNFTVEDLNARGFGSLTCQPPADQNVSGKGIWKDGKWSVVFMRSLEGKGTSDVTLGMGSTTPVAFAVWDGSLGDRNGQKMVTNWYTLTIGVK